jgi:hypothetical protein
MKRRRPSKPWQPTEGAELVGLLGASGDWMLWQRHTVAGWHNFAITPPPDAKLKKSVFHGAWNGERLCGNADLGVLAEHHLEIYVELEKLCPTIEWDFDQ